LVSHHPAGVAEDLLQGIPPFDLVPDKSRQIPEPGPVHFRLFTGELLTVLTAAPENGIYAGYL
jgi:hypothetical protein